MSSIINIFVYPIKGLKGINLNSSNVLNEGLKNDRRWMLVDDSDSFISQRTYPQLALFQTSIAGDTITISFDNDYMSYSISEQLRSDPLTSYVWKSKATFYEVSKVVSEWFSDKLKSYVRLVKQDEKTPRIKNYSNRKGSTVVSLADGYPILIIGTASLDLLNSKLKKQVDFDRFRANIIVQTDEPHIEDTWNTVNIGSSQIEIIKPCARCQVINIDQCNASSSSTVLKTLSTYRKTDHKVYFGANASCLLEGVISVGDVLLQK